MTLDQLEQLARSATPGPWRLSGSPDYNDDAAGVLGPDDAEWRGWPTWIVDQHHTSRADASYIAALSPDVALALIRVARAAGKLVEQARTGREDWQAMHDALAALERT